MVYLKYSNALSFTVPIVFEFNFVSNIFETCMEPSYYKENDQPIMLAE